MIVRVSRKRHCLLEEDILDNAELTATNLGIYAYILSFAEIGVSKECLNRRFNKLSENDINIQLDFIKDILGLEEIEEVKFVESEFKKPKLPMSLKTQLLNKSGIYFLYDEYMDIAYIGKSLNLSQRITSSCFEKKLCKASYILCEMSDANVIEPYLISLLQPPLNIEFSTSKAPTFKIDIPDSSEIFTLIY